MMQQLRWVMEIKKIQYNIMYLEFDYFCRSIMDFGKGDEIQYRKSTNY